MLARFVIHSHRLHAGLPNSRASRLVAWGGAFLLHTTAALALLLAWPQTREFMQQVNPIAVRLLAAPKPAEPIHPVSSPPQKTQAPRQVVQPVSSPPVTQVPLQPATPAPQPLLATTAPTASAFSVAPISVQRAPAATSSTDSASANPAPVAPRPALLVEAHLDANYLSNPKPIYPSVSRRQGETGVVRLRVHVGADGQALEVELKDSSGYPRLDQAAREAVAHWYFVPARRGDSPVASWVVVPIVFSLT
jgi:protein TonB